MTTLVFDDEQAARLHALYSVADVVERRRVARRALAVRPGERVLDIGCGPGLLAAEIAAEAGPSGLVAGIDASPQMLATAQRILADRLSGPMVELQHGQATALPFGDAAFDAAVCVQVLEYVSDVAAALGEMRRVVRPGGRVLIWDTDWHALVWAADDDGRMRRVLEAWEEHLVHPALPRTFGAALRDAGFRPREAFGHLTVNLHAGPANYSAGVIELIQSFVPGRRSVGEGEVADWAAELWRMSAEGRYYLASPQVCVVADRI